MTDDLLCLSQPTWQFDRGQWTEIDCPFVADKDLDAKEAEWDDTLKKAGYWIGDYASSYDPVIIHEAHHETLVTKRWRFLIEACFDGTTPWLIFVTDLPSLLALTSQLTAIRLPAQLDHLTEIVEQFTSKTFEAWHGHSVTSICPACSPAEWKLVEERREARRNRKAQTTI